MFRWRIRSITFSGGETVELGEGAVLLLIGPNNSGKSRALRDIRDAVFSARQEGVVVQTTDIQREGSAEEFAAWLDRYYPKRRRRDGNQFYFTKDQALSVDRVERAFNQGPTMAGAQHFLLHMLGTEDRLALTKRVQSIDVYADQPQAYIHELQTNDALMREVSEIVRASFGVGLIINWTAGPQVGFHVGDEPRRTIDEDRVSDVYQRAVNELPQLDNEGDGIRSFVGTLLAARCGAHPVLLIDEPEAFLHPPQARRLAAAIAQSSPEPGRQIIIATHSAEVVRGALESADNVAVCRLRRTSDSAGNDVNHASILASEQVTELWSRPVLRSSSAWDGLFHRGVVVCESDSDCRFYEAALTRLERAGRLSQSPDLYFVHGGGKGQLTTLAGAYVSLNTPCAIVADLDLLNDSRLLGDLVKLKGGEWTQLESDYNTTCSAIADLPPTRSADQFTDEVSRLLQNVSGDGPVDSVVRREMRSLIDQAADWSEAKRVGVAKLAGGARRAADALLNALGALGIFLVPVGELERWWPQGPAGDKARWFIEALERMEVDDPVMNDATSYVERIVSWFETSGSSADPTV